MDNNTEQVRDFETRLLALAKNIGDNNRAYAQARLSNEHHKQDLEARKLYLTPPGGFEGKNETERRANAETTWSSDSVVQSLLDDLGKDFSQMTGIEANIAADEAERRGIEWVITHKLVEALHERWSGLNPGQVLASKLATNSAREDALKDLAEPDTQVEPEPEPEPEDTEETEQTEDIPF